MNTNQRIIEKNAKIYKKSVYNAYCLHFTTHTVPIYLFSCFFQASLMPFSVVPQSFPYPSSIYKGLRYLQDTIEIH